MWRLADLANNYVINYPSGVNINEQLIIITGVTLVPAIASGIVTKICYPGVRAEESFGPTNRRPIIFSFTNHRDRRLQTLFSCEFVLD